MTKGRMTALRWKAWSIGNEEELALILDQLPSRQRQIVEHIHLQEMSSRRPLRAIT
jgi:DNA-directed RNA polymerase specialized sigma24 family protein